MILKVIIDDKVLEYFNVYDRYTTSVFHEFVSFFLSSENKKISIVKED